MTPVPTARGRIRYETQLDAQLSIMTLPAGQDPDDVIRTNPALWQQLVEWAEPVVDYYFRVVTADLDLASAQGKAEAVRRLATIIREIGDSVERTHYTQKLARLVRMDEKALARQIGSGRRAGPPPSLAPAASSTSPAFSLEEYCLSRLLRYPNLLASMDALLQEAGEPALRAEDFNQPGLRELFSLARQASDQGQILDAEVLWQDVPPSLQLVFDELWTGWPDATEVSLDRVEKHLGDEVLRLRAKNLKQRGREIRFLFEDAMARGDARAREEYGEKMRAHTTAKRRVDHALAMRSAVGQRRRQDSVGRESPVRAG
jgi:DNA primase